MPYVLITLSLPTTHCFCTKCFEVDSRPGDLMKIFGLLNISIILLYYSVTTFFLVLGL